MKKFLFCISFLILSFSVFSFEKIEEGVHYTVIDGAKESSSPKVTEMFSLYCPHCFRLEKFIHPLIDELPDEVEFERSHVSFVAGYSRNMQIETSKAYAFKVLQGESDEFVARMFDEVQGKGIKINTKEKFNSALKNAGIPVSDKAWAENEDVISLVNRMEDRQKDYLSKGAITGVPSLIVNDKYVIKLTSIRSQDPIGDLKSIINHLQKNK